MIRNIIFIMCFINLLLVIFAGPRGPDIRVKYPADPINSSNYFGYTVKSDSEPLRKDWYNFNDPVFATNDENTSIVIGDKATGSGGEYLEKGEEK